MKRIFLTAYLLLCVASVQALNPTGFEQSIHHGYVFARAIVKDEATGLPLWAEYNEQGGFTKLPQSLVVGASQGKVVSGKSYQAYKVSLDSFEAQYEGKVDRYTKEEFLDIAPSLTTKDDLPITGWPTSFSSDVLSIAIPAKEKRLQSNAAYIDRLIFPVDLKYNRNVPDNFKSILLDATGATLHESQDRIGFLTAFYVKNGEELEPTSEYEYSSTLKRLHDYKVLDPVPGVFIEGITGYINGAAFSGEDGRYRLKMLLSPCPGFDYFPKSYANARLYYANFNPKGSPAVPYYIEHESYDYCNGLYMLLKGIPDLGAQMAAIQVAAIVSSAPENITNFNYAIAINVIAGSTYFPGVEIVETPTKYEANQSPGTEYMTSNDYDGDGIKDATVRGAIDAEGKFVADAGAATYGVILSGSPLADGAPNFMRVIDVKQDVQHKGLLTEINKDDLMNTDIYVFRESTGDLITERKGIPEEEITRGTLGHLQLDRNNQFTYTMPFRSTEDSASFKRKRFDGWQAWQVANQMSPELQEHKSDFLRNGEKLRIVAINRATGYIGTATTTLEAAKDGGDITSRVPNIKMAPPNLKVWATRQVEPEGLLKDADRGRYTISNEGAAEVNDYVIEVHTQWLDADGFALPDGLKERGYTARLVKVAADPSGGGDVFSTEVTEFAINPGRELQVVSFNEGKAGKYHYHLQVSGESDVGLVDFSVGDLTGVLQHRPSKYVPVRVPLFNEDETNNNRFEQIEADLEKLDVEAAFDWVIRPELSFSVVDLEVESIFRNKNDKQLNDILDEEIPVIASSDDAVKFLFDLTQSSFDRITPLDGEQEYILAFGEEEVSIKIVNGNNSEREIEFTNLEHLTEIESEDFLTARIYLNQDSSNILWEYAFDLLYIESSKIGHNNQTESTYYVTADDTVVDLKAGIAGYAYLDDDDKYNPSIEWKLEGTGNLSSRIQRSPQFALFDNTLTMPTTKGAKAKISARLRNTNTEAQWKTVEVLAGKPHRIEVTQIGSAISLDQGDVTLNISVFDKFGNLVEDGTDIDVEFSESLRIKEQKLGTENGTGFIRFTGGSFSSDSTTLTITSGDATATTDMAVAPLKIAVDVAKTTLKKRETISFTATVTKLDGSPAVNIPVSLSAGKGIFAEQNLLTDSQGQVTTTFTAGLNEHEDTWTALAGYVAITEMDYKVVGAGPQTVNAQETMLVADEILAGDISFDAYGVQTSIGFETQAKVTVKGHVGDIVKIGDMADPNLEPLLALSMNELIGDQVSDAHELNDGLAKNITIVKDHPLGAGRSAHFNADSTVTVKANDLLSMNNMRGFRLDLKPLSNGEIINYGGDALKLEYIGSNLKLTTNTTNGTISVTASNVDLSKWHRIAANVEGQTLNLYVDGEIYSENFSGILSTAPGNDIVLGGLQARMRGFKVFDYSSEPLITFEGGDTQSTLQSTQDTLTVVSSGNLGGLVANSKLKSHRVALIIGTDRNYASLLTKAGYQSIAQDYLYTASPQTPLALHTISNPLGGFVSTAHAWSWDGVWEGVKGTVGMLIPYEDFIIIAEQLTFLVNKDWKNFDPSALAFASLGAATILPMARPLKPLLAPIKKLVDGMNRFPGARHFAGAVGTAVKSALGGKTDRLENLLPFILIAIELYKDPEVFEFIMNTIVSEDDLWMWVGYVATLVEVNGGLVTGDTVASGNILLPSSLGFIPQAYAAGGKSRQQVGQDAIKIIKPLAKKVKNIKKFKSGLKTLLEEVSDPKNIKWGTITKSQAGFRYLTTLGGAKLRAFIRNSKNWRVNRWVVLTSLVYLSDEISEKRLNISDRKWGNLVADVFSGWAWKQHGATFQLSQIAYYHLKHQYGSGPGIIDIEALRPAYVLVDGVQPPGVKSYNRLIDIVVDDDDGGEKWVETKSLSGPFKNNWFKPLLAGIKKTNSGTSSGFNAQEDRSYFRQFFHDMRLNEDFINQDGKGDILGIGGTSNDSYQWYFHDYNTKTASKPPTASDIKLAQGGFCKAPSDVKPKKYFYDDNLAGDSRAMTALCKLKSGNISARDTKSYFKEILVDYADQLEITDLIDIAAEIDVF